MILPDSHLGEYSGRTGASLLLASTVLLPTNCHRAGRQLDYTPGEVRMATKKSTRKSRSVSAKVVLTPAQRGVQTRAANQAARARAAADRELKRLAKARAAKRARDARAAAKSLAKLARDVGAVTKQGKKGAKQIEKTTKTAIKAAKKIASLFSRGGKEKVFSSRPVSEKVVEKPKAKRGKSRAAIKSELQIQEGETYNQFISRLLENQDEINGYLKPGERFVASYMGGQMKRSYPNIGDMLSVMNSYEASKAYGDQEAEDSAAAADLLEGISIRKVRSDSGYEEKNKARLAKVEKAKDEFLGQLRREVGERTETGKKKSAFELMSESKAKADAEKADLEKRLANMGEAMEQMHKRMLQLEKKTPTKRGKKK